MHNVDWIVLDGTLCLHSHCSVDSPYPQNTFDPLQRGSRGLGLLLIKSLLLDFIHFSGVEGLACHLGWLITVMTFFISNITSLLN